MPFVEDLRSELNRWLYQNTDRIIAESCEALPTHGRHAILQEITISGEGFQLGGQSILTLAQCENSSQGRRLRNMLLNYNPQKQAVMIFRNPEEGTIMTVVLSHDARRRTDELPRVNLASSSPLTNGARL